MHIYVHVLTTGALHQGLSCGTGFACVVFPDSWCPQSTLDQTGTKSRIAHRQSLCHTITVNTTLCNSVTPAAQILRGDYRRAACSPLRRPQRVRQSGSRAVTCALHDLATAGGVQSLRQDERTVAVEPLRNSGHPRDWRSRVRHDCHRACSCLAAAPENQPCTLAPPPRPLTPSLQTSPRDLLRSLRIGTTPNRWNGRSDDPVRLR